MKLKHKAKILFVSPIPPPFGGIASWTDSIMKWAKNHHRRVGIIDTSKFNSGESSPSNGLSFFGQLKRAKYIFKNLKENLNEGNYDVVHINSSGAFPGIFRDLISAMIALKYKTVIILQLHVDVPRIYNKDFKVRLLLRILTYLVDEVWVLNNNSYDMVSLIVEKNKIRTVSNFINSNIINKTPTYNFNMKNIVYIGSISKNKGISEIIDVAKHFKDLTFHLIGPIAEPYIIKNIPDNVIVHGALSHVKTIKVLRKMDVFLFPSYSEGFSIAILEAMAQGLPIITTPVGANKEMINDGAIFVDIRNVDQIINGLGALEKVNIRKNMGEKNLKVLKDSFTSEVVIKNIFLHYDKLI